MYLHQLLVPLLIPKQFLIFCLDYLISEGWNFKSDLNPTSVITLRLISFQKKISNQPLIPPLQPPPPPKKNTHTYTFITKV